MKRESWKESADGELFCGGIDYLRAIRVSLPRYVSLLTSVNEKRV